ncbi:MAG: hypothetical protein CSA34_04920 [Desulfobulbus propionicus]|nr:MAG: hypothetical protein CSA34_04920 [Desulfobulbus propionicus]
MRQYLIDELSFLERDNLESYLKRTLKPGGLEGVFFLPVPQDLLGPEQQGHDDCGPFYFPVVLGTSSIRFELLVRSATNMHCTCIARVTEAQRRFVLDFADHMLNEEKITA